MLAFVISLDDVVITEFVKSGGQDTLPTYMLGQLRRVVTPEINAISTVFLLLSVVHRHARSSSSTGRRTELDNDQRETEHELETDDGRHRGMALLASAGSARAEGELNIYNWGNYTSPELIKKFEETYKVKVTITDYDSNDTALAKVRAGGHGFDIVVPSANYVPIWIKEGLLLESAPDQMENFKNVDPTLGRRAVGIRAATIPCRGSGARPASSSTPTSTRATSTPRRSSSTRRPS